jgi:hypothetical protein
MGFIWNSDRACRIIFRLFTRCLDRFAAGLFSDMGHSEKLMGAFVMIAVIGVLISTVWLVSDKNYLQFAPDHDHTIFHTDFSEHLQATIDMKRCFHCRKILPLGCRRKNAGRQTRYRFRPQ